MATRKRLGALAFFAIVAVPLAACADILGFGELTPDDEIAEAGPDGPPTHDAADGTASDVSPDAADAPDTYVPPPGAPAAPTGVTGSAIPVTSTVSTLAGSGSPGNADGQGTAASFNPPQGISVDGMGRVFVSEPSPNNRLRRITPAGVVSSMLAGVYNPRALTVTSDGTTIYVADTNNYRVAVVSGGSTTSLKDDQGNAFSFSGAFGIARDAAGNVYVQDNGTVLKITPAGVKTVHATGLTPFAAITSDAAGILYAGDNTGNVVRKIAANGVVSTLAGSGAAGYQDGTRFAADFSNPLGVALDAKGNVYVADRNNNRIRRITAGGVVTTLAGNGDAALVDGAGTVASFNAPLGVGVDPSGAVFVSDTSNYAVRKIVSAGIGQLTVAWTAPNDTGSSPITGYEVAATAAGLPAQSCKTTGETTCTVSGLTSGVSYDLVVTASNAVGRSAASSVGNGTPN